MQPPTPLRKHSDKGKWQLSHPEPVQRLKPAPRRLPGRRRARAGAARAAVSSVGEVRANIFIVLPRSNYKQLEANYDGSEGQRLNVGLISVVRPGSPQTTRSENVHSGVISSCLQHHVERSTLVTTASVHLFWWFFMFCSSAVEKMSHFFLFFSLFPLLCLLFSPLSSSQTTGALRSVPTWCESVALCAFAYTARTFLCVCMPV